ncbi:hypothetical protein SDC9_134608 [bioreactor metagenome]|uniref:Uncharacterized protein n=1 Tax=bioreactor metagenome TaxID=1076179 RepID=A0A645DG10_9ZZZZ
MAPINAKMNVSAIGRNIFPSTPESESMGIKTMRIISCPKIAEFIMVDELFSVILSISLRLLRIDRWFSPTAFAVI